MERLAYSINDTAKTLSLGRTSIYAMIANGTILQRGRCAWRSRALGPAQERPATK